MTIYSTTKNYLYHAVQAFFVMDVETTMKINDLAKELVKKGMAPSSEEAYKMAEQMMQKEILPQKTTASGKSDDRIDILIERLARKYDHELETIKKQMMIMIEEIEKINCNVKSLQNASVIKKTPPAEQPTTSEEPKEEQTELKSQNKSESNQRQGQFKPGDESVDVNKIFYYGNK